MINIAAQVVADGVFITGHGLVIDEAALTGESEPLKKNEERPFVRSGTQVSRVVRCSSDPQAHLCCALGVAICMPIFSTSRQHHLLAR